MYYQEKKIIASIISGALILGVYSIFGITKYIKLGVSLLSDMKFWATAMLITIGGGIIIAIIIQIIFHIILAITNEIAKKTCPEGKERTYEDLEISDFEDEMDKLIALKAMKNSYIFVGIGFVLSLLSLYLRMPSAIMLNIVFVSFSLGSIFEGLSQLYFYRKGI